jgi:hypothetical protein
MSLIALAISIIACLLISSATKDRRRQQLQILRLNDQIKSLEASNQSLLLQIGRVEAQAEHNQHVLNHRVLAAVEDDTTNPLPTSGNNSDLHDLLDQAESSLKACELLQIQAIGVSQKCTAELDGTRLILDLIEPPGSKEERERDYKAMREYKGSPQYQAMTKHRKV